MFKLIPVLIAFTLLLVGCGSPPTSNSRQYNNIDIEMWSSSTCVQGGDTIKLRATATNHSNKMLVVDAVDKPVLDIVAGSCEEGYCWSSGKPLTPELTQLQLAPGHSKSIEMNLHLPKDLPAVVAVQAHFIYNPYHSASADTTTNPTVVIYGSACPGIGP